MATNTLEVLHAPKTAVPTAGQLVDRWIYVFMAAFFLATTFAGFIPDSFERVAAIRAGQRFPFPPVLHVHAVLMGAWLLLLLAQTSLVATGRRRLHRKLGVASVVLVPAIVIAGFILVPTTLRSAWAFVSSPPPGVDAAAIAPRLELVSNLFLFQIRTGIWFPVTVALALMFRRTDPETHKRLMILATVVPLPAAIDRIEWLPTTLPVNAVSMDLYVLLWIAPLLVRDVVRYGRVPRAYFLWLAVGLPLTIPAHALWGSPWWHATVPKLMGIAP